MTNNEIVIQKHKEWINIISTISKKKGGFKTKNNDINNFLRLCIYRNDKGVLPKEIKHAFEIAGIILE